MSKPDEKKKPRVTITRLSDVAEWGEKDQRGAYSRPFKLPGGDVNVDDLPALHDIDKPAKNKRTKKTLRRDDPVLFWCLVALFIAAVVWAVLYLTLG